MHIRYYAQKEADSECVGPHEGEAILLENSTLLITIEYRYTLVPKFRNTMKFSYQVLYIDNQRAALYWCYQRAQNGSCVQHDVNFMIRSRHFSHNDLSMVLPYLEKIEKAGTWFLMARFDEMALDTYAMVMRITTVSQTSAVLRLFQSAALPGEPLDCFTRVFTVKELQNGTDYFYELHFEASTKNSTTS
ncbi:hypothetical protein NECAME_09788 [Necator americanus]|uniref:Uncharacterized protein n=1 Tax=Necator americanus TaxID=51031 RepID=W2TCH6_NECAM|nr:hypothetical protein NECAME_09788 [Necator americanus]ETN79548.1 hypothetical protein NECAME_09788 [Necator americanus]